MKNKILLLGAVALAGSLFSSCLNNDDKTEQTFTYPYSNCFNVVTNEADGSVFIGRTPSYEFVYHIGMTIDGYVDITMTNLQLASNLSPISFQLPSMPFANPSQFALETSSSMFSPSSQGGATYLFDYLNIKNIVGPNVTVYNIDYKLTNVYTQNSYTVKVYGKDYTYRGDITFTSDEGVVSVSEASYSSGLGVTLNSETMTAALFGQGLVIKDGKSESFGVGGLPLTLTDDGYTVASEPGQKIQLMNSALTNPKNDWYISDIKVDATLEKGASISFTIYNGDSEIYTASAPGLTYFIAVQQ